MSAEVVIAVRDAAKTYGARRALDGVSFSVERGEMVALIGPSGSGKSTLLRALTGLARIDGGAGMVEAFGRPVQSGGRITDQVRQVRARIGMVFQQFNLVGRLDLFTNVALGMLGRLGFWRGLFGRWPAAEKSGVMSALARVGVAEYAGQRAGTLSGGQQQRAAIARALVQQAELILADEPVASLDPVSARRVMELLKALNEDQAITVVVSLHQVDYAMRYCRRVVALKAGRIAYDGPASGLTHAELIDIYGPEIEEIFWEGDAK
ncbi:MAG TPA: phosphonate ABC transporter ATP-binding protein [Caulobacteraceae bacterium]|nr:phosphonate ABC transporter ATP-binding protein [Caulobacteraceae bacterium]